MKKYLTALALSLAFACNAFAKEQPRQVEAFTLSPAMHCENCEKKIKSNLRFEKGVSKIDINRDAQIVTITFDPDKTDESKLIKAFKKIGYTATPEPEKKDGE